MRDLLNIFLFISNISAVIHNNDLLMFFFLAFPRDKYIQFYVDLIKLHKKGINEK